MKRHCLSGLDFFSEDVPDATTLLRFRHLLEEHNLQKEMFETMNVMLEESGKIMKGGTIVDATIIDAPSLTKNSVKSRDPEMKSTRKDNKWHFGMKAHIGVDTGTGIVHSVEVTAANVHDIEVASKLIRADDDVVYWDAGYTGIEKRDEIKNDEHLSKVEYRINKKKGADKRRRDSLLKEPMKHLDYIAQIDWDGRLKVTLHKSEISDQNALKSVKDRFYAMFSVFFFMVFDSISIALSI